MPFAIKSLKDVLRIEIYLCFLLVSPWLNGFITIQLFLLLPLYLDKVVQLLSE